MTEPEHRRHGSEGEPSGARSARRPPDAAGHESGGCHGPGPVDGAAARRALGRLADGERETDRAVVAWARAATGDLDAALSFVERVGVERLRRAADRLDGPAAADARAALAAFERYRRAAREGEA